MAKRLEVLELTQESFKEFGSVIAIESKTPDACEESFNWYEKYGAFENMDMVSVNILECKKRDYKIDKLEVHKQTSEAVIPLGGEDTIAVFAPSGDLDESKIKAFRIPGDKGVVLNVGVRHFIPYPAGDKNVNCIIVFKHGTGANDLVFDHLSEVYEF
jgi:ureidoglycolate lyase